MKKNNDKKQSIATPTVKTTDKKDKKNNTEKAGKIDKKELKKNIAVIQEILKEYHVPEDATHVKIVLEKIQERVEYYIKILIQILQPEEFHSLHECTSFDDADKTKIFDMYKNMMILHREIIKSEIKNEETDIVTTINYAHSELKKLKPEMINILHKMQESWKKTGTNGRVRYFG
jgi:hypothetical protein